MSGWLLQSIFPLSVLFVLLYKSSVLLFSLHVVGLKNQLLSSLIFDNVQVPYFSVTYKDVIFGGTLCGTIYNLSSIFLQIYEGGKGKNGSTVAVSFFNIMQFALLL